MAGQRIGYVRVSTLEQNEERQSEGQILDRVFTDKASGRETARPQLTGLLRFARAGDTVVVHSMDRLARNLDDLRALNQGLTRRGVGVEFVKENLVFTDPRTRPWPPSCSPSWRLRRIRTLPHQGTPAGKHRLGQAARRLQRTEKDPHPGTSSRTCVGNA